MRRYKVLYHLGILHFSPTFSAAVYYFISRVAEGRWALAMTGFCLIMFFGVFIDIDHYLGKKAVPRRKKFVAGLKKGKITLGDPDPTGVNFFHTTPGFFLMLGLGIVLMQFDQLLGLSCVLVNAFHVLVVDILDFDNQRMPTSPLPVAIHNFFWNHFKWFRKLCFGTKKGAEKL